MINTILQGDSLAVLKTLPDGLVDCVVTSPPYWGLRDYGLPDIQWPAMSYIPMAGLPEVVVMDWSGSLGLEPSVEMFVAHIVYIFREVRRVLKDTGVMFLNMGDGYNGSGKASGQGNGTNFGKPLSDRPYDVQTATKVIGLKPKDLIGQPWRLAFALQADGWYLRSDIIWHKPNPMPESVTDRPTKSHEYVFLMSKKAQYFYDAEAIREDSTTTRPELLEFGERPDVGYSGHMNDRRRAKKPDGWDSGNGGHGKIHRDGREKGIAADIRHGRNKRTVWTIATQSYSEAHFATFPEKLVEPCIRAGTSECGYCAECGLPWVRVVESSYETTGNNRGKKNTARTDQAFTHPSYDERKLKTNITIGWQPTCACDADTVPGLVLDPFFGSGTVGVVAAKNGRNWLGIELNPEYIEMAKKRIPARQEQLIF